MSWVVANVFAHLVVGWLDQVEGTQRHVAFAGGLMLANVIANMEEQHVGALLYDAPRLRFCRRSSGRSLRPAIHCLSRSPA
jgi:hypothetical protein